MAKKLEYPNGWLMRAHRYMPYSEAEYLDAINIFDKAHTKKQDIQKTEGAVYFTSHRDVVFGNYDRIQIEPVRDLTVFERKTDWIHDWLGSSQSILFYKWRDKETNRRFQIETDSDGKQKMIVSGAHSTKNYFISATFCYLSDKVRDSCRNTSYAQLLDRCEQSVLDLVNAFNEKLNSEGNDDDKRLHSEVFAEVFGTMSAAEFVILWSAKQYTDIMYLVDCLRDFKINGISGDSHLLRTTDTLISFPDAIKHNSEPEQDAELCHIQGDACLQFATQDGAGEKSFSPFEAFFQRCMENAAWFLNEGTPDEKYELRRSAGEYDLITTVPSRYVTRLFCNPQLWLGDHWSENIERLHREYHDNIDAFCSSFHPEYNEYIRYSFTRLTYLESHLPSFVQFDAWETKRKQLSIISLSLMQDEMFLHQRMERIASIVQESEGDLAQLEELLAVVRSYVPAVSNLALELNQLFYDYTQCMCSSADGLWIDDYQQVFQEMLLQLLRLFSQKQSQGSDSEADQLFVNDISELIRSIRRQTNHISTSGKLFFREQETHFGYTAQHDLVLHAYYGIVKNLMRVIYSYSDKRTQSALYPIVDFQPGDRISSEIYFEESAQCYVDQVRALTGDVELHELNPRIMVIHVPLDGMNNLMYYLPMMVHEVFHYAAPLNRNERNRILAEMMVYQALKYGLFHVFGSVFEEKLGLVQKKRKQKLEENDQWKILNALYSIFSEVIVPAVENVVADNRESIWKGIYVTFFAEEAAGFSDEKIHGLRNGEILRSWFITWLENWLFDNTNDEVESNGKGNDIGFRGVSGLFEPLFKNLKKELGEHDPDGIPNYRWEGFTLKPSVMKDIYRKSVAEIQSEIIEALNKDPKEPVEDNQSLVQRYLISVQQYAERSNYQESYQTDLRNMDEIFPDIAMATITQMSAAGYMLQIALDMDKKMYDCSEANVDGIRFAGVLEWLIDLEMNDANLRLQKLEEHLKRFRKLYCASYELADLNAARVEQSQDKEQHRSKIVAKANKWAATFDRVYCDYTDPSNDLLRCGIRKLIEGQMLPCLKDDGTGVHSRQELFQKPYHEYLSQLEKLWNNQDNEEQQEAILGDLFHLSIGTILRFQYYCPLRQMNNDFREKKPMPRDAVSTREPDRPDAAPIHITRVVTPGDYLPTIHRAWHMLNQWRKEVGVSTSCGMWYRGASNAGHAVLPCGFVHFAEDVGNLCRSSDISELKGYSFLDIQRHRYESFRYAAEGAAPDVSPAVYRNTLDYLTLMQHYNQRGSHHTNMMDWSEDFFASTYFALETEIDRNDGYRYKKERDEAKEISEPPPDAALYILDPIHFNRACQEIEQDGLFAGVPIYLSGDVPNLSIPENQRRMEEYHNLYPGGDPMKPCEKPSDWLEVSLPAGSKSTNPVSLRDIKQYAGNGQMKMHLPRAVFIAKLNNRIQAQSGMFIAYSLMSNPVVWKGTSFETQKVNDSAFRYQSLESIQDYYLNLPGKQRRPFLMKIVIPSTMRRTLADLFHRLGLSREGVYPELDNDHGR